MRTCTVCCVLLAAASAAVAAEPPLASVPPLRISAPPPAFPRQALKMHVGGDVVVKFTVNVYGAVRDLRVVRSNPPGVFDAAAVASVRTWIYNPALLNGKPVEAPVQEMIRFAPPDAVPLSAALVRGAGMPPGRTRFDALIENLRKRLAGDH